MQREALANAAEARRNRDRLPPLPNEPPPPGRGSPSRDRSPVRRSHVSSSSVDSYRPNYRSRHDDPEKRDWEMRVDQWRRNREVDRWTPTGSYMR